MILTSAEIVTIIESIKKQYPIGENIINAIQQIADQAMLVNILIEENALLRVENDKLKLK